jgi:hypothetical protein
MKPGKVEGRQVLAYRKQMEKITMKKETNKSPYIVPSLTGFGTPCFVISRSDGKFYNPEKEIWSRNQYTFASANRAAERLPS